VRAHLDRPVAGIGHFDYRLRRADIELDKAIGGNDFAWDHGWSPSADRAWAPAQPSALSTRTVEAGLLASLLAGRIGRGTRVPPQLGHVPFSFRWLQSAQYVHSKLQIMASSAAGGRSLPQHSQLGRNSSMEATGSVRGR
jgi:hypothetical protein